jgi:hypothetical protein
VQAKGIRYNTTTSFTPPIGQEAISYTQEGIALNSIDFSREERFDSIWDHTGLDAEKLGQESFGFRALYRYDNLFIRLQFPVGCFPEKIWAEARLNGQLDEEETRFIAPNFAPRAHERYVILSVTAPIPQYVYGFAWDLPESRDTDLIPWRTFASESFAGKAKRQGQVQDALNELREKLRAQYLDDRLKLVLYGYVRQNNRGGLAPLSAAPAVIRAAGTGMIPVGRTVVGQCFRRKSVTLLDQSNVQNPGSQEALPGEKMLPAIALCVPIRCPEPEGKTVGVLYLSTPDMNSGLRDLGKDDDKQKKLTLNLTAWNASILADAVGLKEHLALPSQT